MNTPALRVENLTVTLDTIKGRRTLVDNISFELHSGQIAGLVGESGCGKTLSAFAILGQLPAAGMQVSSGAIEVNGKDFSKLSARQRRQLSGNEISMVFQQPGRALDPVFTIGDQIEEVFRRHIGGSKKTVRNATLDALASVGFEQPDRIFRSYAHQLSGGMRQLAMIAMATICKPAVLIADEPTTALDMGTRTLILQKLSAIQRNSDTAILVISHDLSVIRKLCSHIMVMYCGRMIEKAPNQELFSHPLHPYTAGLINCIPDIDNQQQGGMSTIAGRVPSMDALPPGCLFEPRCQYSVYECTLSRPQLVAQCNGCVACFRPLE